MLDQLTLDQRRIHFAGSRPRHEYIKVLQASTAHLYFSEPFVTSWSLAEALATGCLVIGSNTKPVQEFIEDGTNGYLVDMDDPEEVADMIEYSFDHPLEVGQLKAKARLMIQKTHDSEHVFAHKEKLLRQLLAAG